MIRFEILEKYHDRLTHGFSVRDGGFSEGRFTSFNFGLTSGDREERVARNLAAFARQLCVPADSFVFAAQEHGSKVAVIDAANLANARAEAACGRPTVAGADAMVTDLPGVNLITLHADCAPVYLYDPARPAVGLVHSGWKGTIADIVSKTIAAMAKEYGSDPARIIAVIGPSIGACCFETRKDVWGRFLRRLPSSKEHMEVLDEEVRLIDLKAIIAGQLAAAGIAPGNLYVSDLCTACRNDVFFSHRATKGATGRMAAVIGLKGGA